METALFSAGVLLETAQFSEGEETAVSPYTGMNTTDKLFERLRDPDSGDLELTWTAQDPRYYAQPPRHADLFQGRCGIGFFQLSFYDGACPGGLTSGPTPSRRRSVSDADQTAKAHRSSQCVDPVRLQIRGLEASQLTGIVST